MLQPGPEAQGAYSPPRRLLSHKFDKCLDEHEVIGTRRLANAAIPMRPLPVQALRRAKSGSRDDSRHVATRGPSARMPSRRLWERPRVAPRRKRFWQKFRLLCCHFPELYFYVYFRLRDHTTWGVNLTRISTCNLVWDLARTLRT